MNKNEKGIIINGVDVSGCNYYRADNLYDCTNSSCIDNCAENHDCHYKQLQRAKVQYDKVVEQNRSLQTENKKLTEDNKALRKTLKEFSEVILSDDDN